MALVSNLLQRYLSDTIPGAGAGFALEDAYVLTQAVKWAHERNLPAGDGLDLFDKVRTPHYKQMVCFESRRPLAAWARNILLTAPKYAVLGRFAAADASIKGSKVPFDEAVALHIKHNWTEEDHWLYHYDVSRVNSPFYYISSSALLKTTGPGSMEKGLRSRRHPSC